MATEFRFPSFDDLTSRIRQAEELFGSPTPLLKAFGITVLAEVARIFREGGRPAWKPLQPRTLAGKRQGKRKGASTALPLQGLRSTFDFAVTGRDVKVFSTSPVAAFHEFGTKGPYVIAAKHAKALALPALGDQLTGKGAGHFTLAGLGRSKPTGRGSFVFRPTPGKQVPTRFRGREGKPVVPFRGIDFRKSVVHPGLPERRMFPTEEQVTPKLIQAATGLILQKLAHR